MGFCRDELCSRSRQRWYDVVDVLLRPHNVDTFLCVVQLLPHGIERNSQSHPNLGFEGLQFYTYAYQDQLKASSDQCENLASLLGSYHATYSCAYKVSRHYLWQNKKMKECPYQVTPRLSIKTNMTKAIYPTHTLIVSWQHGRNCLQL